jgi:GDP-4-dehydro-6-deoxy-D-mannose reductase
VTNVQDIVAAYYRLMLAYIQDRVGNGEVFHISTMTLHKMEYYLDFMLDLFNLKVEKIVDEKLLRPIDIPVQILDSSKLRNRIGWHPTIPLEETLRGLVNYWMVTI